MLSVNLFLDQTCYDLVRGNRKMRKYTVTDSNHPNSAAESYHIMRVKHNTCIFYYSKEFLYASIAVGDLQYTCNIYINSFSRTKTYE